MKKHKLLFLATDRNVLNLPAVGKSMTFNTIGITEKGKRILSFKHDPTRRHSPIIDSMNDIYIVENKSVAAYLRQIQNIGENIEDYKSIWKYTEGNTEKRFKLYDYPLYNFKTTDLISNFSIK